MVVAVLVTLAPPTAAEARSSRLNRKVSGAFTGTTTFAFSAEGCSFVHQVFDGTYIRRQGAPGGRFHIDVCVELQPTGIFRLAGSFQLTTQGGARLTGAASGEVGQALPGNVIPLEFTLTVTEATKRFRRATGSLGLEGQWVSSLEPSRVDPIEGTLAGSLRRQG
jgi:hypothetical protein